MVLAAVGDGSSPAEETDSTAAEIVVYRSPTCSCCGVYEAYLGDEGFTVRTELVDDSVVVRDRFGVPDELASCHTATVGGYVVEGHVPVAGLDRLLDERPAVTGLALPGMPPGAPGMGGTQETPLGIVSFDGRETEPFATL